MPKKIVVKKKKVKKQKKQKKPIIIPTQLPRTKCCDEYKTGSAFTIPLGYSDRLGMNRLGQTPNVTNIYYSQPFQPLGTVLRLGKVQGERGFAEPNRNVNIQTQTEDNKPIRIPITYKPIPAKKLYQPVEFQPLEEGYPSMIPIDKNIVIQRRPVLEEPFLGITDIYSEPSTTNEAVSEITNPVLSARKSGYKSKEELTRRYIDLLQSYRGIPYDEANKLAKSKTRKELEELIKEFSG
ncbi:MAG: hypothetical protein ACOYMA_18305 [Bacteroidia bacterium]